MCNKWKLFWFWSFRSPVGAHANVCIDFVSFFNYISALCCEPQTILNKFIECTNYHYSDPHINRWKAQLTEFRHFESKTKCCMLMLIRTTAVNNEHVHFGRLIICAITSKRSEILFWRFHIWALKKSIVNFTEIDYLIVWYSIFNLFYLLNSLW